MLELYPKACITPGTSEWVGIFGTEELSKLSLFTDKTGASQKETFVVSDFYSHGVTKAKIAFIPEY